MLKRAENRREKLIKVSTRHSARTDFIAIEEFRREYELIMAKLKLGKRIGAAAGPMNVKQVIATCTEYQEYETAATRIWRISKRVSYSDDFSMLNN